MGKINITTSIDTETNQLARKYNIRWCDALDFGIKFLSAEYTGIDYPNNNLLIKISKLQDIIKQKTEELDRPSAEEEVDKVFKEVGNEPTS